PCQCTEPPNYLILLGYFLPRDHRTRPPPPQKDVCIILRRRESYSLGNRSPNSHNRALVLLDAFGTPSRIAASGQKQRYAVQKRISGLRSKADIVSIMSAVVSARLHPKQ